MKKTSQTLYSHAQVATDVVVFTVHESMLKVLLIQMKKAPYTGFWAAPGGLVGGAESVDDSAVRILAEKAGVKKVYLEQLYTFGGVKRDPFGRVVSVAYFALIPSAHLQLHTTNEYIDVQWFPVGKLPKLAYDHAQIIKTAVERVKGKLSYSNIAHALLPKEFTLRALQHVYEVILGKSLDKRNFRKKILSIGLVKKLKKMEKGVAYRPAELYSFTTKGSGEIRIL